MRIRYRFVRSYIDSSTGHKIYLWERRIPGDSRVEQIICDAEWFWDRTVGA